MDCADAGVVYTRPASGSGRCYAVYFFSRDRSGERRQRHLANYGSILQADAYAGFNALYKDDRPLGPITEAACWAHARRKFFVLADIATKARTNKPVIVSPIALEAGGVSM
jgi:transposase